MKSLRRSTPDVRIRRSRGGSEAVKRWEVIAEEVMVSGDLYWWGSVVVMVERGFGVGEPV